MCVAVIVESQNRIPSAHLEAMHKANDDGAGLAWISGDQIQYRKGLTWQEIDELQDKIPRPFLMHFRIATRGAPIPELTHPFPIGMQAFSDDLVGLAPAVLIHNGTWSDFRRYVPNGIDPNKVSDTQIAAYAMEFDEDILNEVSWSNALLRAKGDGRADLTLRGRWMDFEGNQYSNLYWKAELDRPKYTHQPALVTYGGKEYKSPGTMTQEEWNAYLKSFGHTYVPRKKGETPKSHQTAKQERKDAKKERRRARRAKEANVALNHDGSRCGANALNDNEFAWDGEPLFNKDGTPNVTRPSVKCPDCKEEITTIPCACGEFEDGDTLEYNILDLSAEEIAEKLENGELTEDDIIQLSFAGIDSEAVDAALGVGAYDVEDLNACGLEYPMEHPDNNIIRSGDRLEDWATVDAYIRAQGIKI